MAIQQAATAGEKQAEAVGGSTSNAAPGAVLPTPVKAPSAEAGETPGKETGPGRATLNSAKGAGAAAGAAGAVLPTPVKAPSAEAGETPGKETGPGRATLNSAKGAGAAAGAAGAAAADRSNPAQKGHKAGPARYHPLLCHSNPRSRTPRIWDRPGICGFVCLRLVTIAFESSIID